MFSNSVREVAELFGATLEAAGLSVGQLACFLRSVDHNERGISEQELWAFKRELQVRDLQNVRSGRLASSSLSWFSGGKAKKAKLVSSPY